MVTKKGNCSVTTVLYVRHDLRYTTVMHPKSYNEGRDEENGGKDHDTPRRSREGGVVASRGGHDGGRSVVDQLKLKLSNFKFQVLAGHPLWLGATVPKPNPRGQRNFCHQIREHQLPHRPSPHSYQRRKIPTGAPSSSSVILQRSRKAHRDRDNRLR